jgi:tetratricopeptide (TPR) repeat protein
MRAYAQNTLARYGATSEALERGLVHADRAGDAVIRSEILAWLPTRLARGPVPTGRALERCRELLAQAEGDLPAEAGALAGIALIEAMVGRFDEARRAERRSRRIKEELGLAFTLAVGDIWLGELELYAGDHPAAEQAFGAAATFLEERGDRNFYPTAAAGLARERGVALASETDDLNLQAESLIELADILRDTERAGHALEQALGLAVSKENVVYARQARARLGRA